MLFKLNNIGIAKEEQEKANKQSAINKLKALGLTDRK
jgi:hypothetical protein